MATGARRKIRKLGELVHAAKHVGEIDQLEEAHAPAQ